MVSFLDAAADVAHSTNRADVPAAGRFAAFISYRHVEPDRKWARWLHTAIETYRIPKNLARQYGLQRRVGRVFRDDEELAASPNLSQRIEQALRASDYLIVICSRQAPSSHWVNAEIEFFRSLGRADRILALLIDGEPADAFPPALLLASSGGAGGSLPDDMPLAADVRTDQPGTPRQRRRMAKLRLLASMLGCGFDELRQRDRERQRRQYAYSAASLTAVLAIIAALVIIGWRAENARLAAESRRLADRSIASTGAGDASRGMLLALAGLPGDMRDRDRPYVPEAEAALYQAVAAHREVRIQAGHADRLEDVAFSPDGAHLATASADRTARLWDARTGVLRAVFRHRNYVNSVAFSPDGQRVATGSEDGSARVWAVRTGRLLTTVRHENGVGRVLFSRDGTRLLTADNLTADLNRDGTRIVAAGGVNARLWDAQTGRLVFRSDRTPVDVASPEYTAWLWDTATGRRRAVLAPHNGELVQAVFSPDGARVATACEDDPVARLWSAHDGTQLRAFTGHDTGLTRMAFTPDGAHLVTTSSDRTARIWNVPSGARRAVLRGHADWLTSVAISPDGRRIVTTSADRTARLWSAADGTLLAVLGGHNDAVIAAAFSPTGSHLVTASHDRTARVWDARPSSEPVLAGHRDEVVYAAFLSDDRTALTQATDGTARLWDTVTGRQLDVLGGPKEHAAFAAASPDGSRLLVALQSSAIGARTLTNSVRLLTFNRRVPLDTGAVFDIDGLIGHAAFSPDGSRLIIVPVNGPASLHDTRTGARLALLRAKDEQLLHAAFSPDGARIATAGIDGVTHLWDSGTARELKQLPTAGSGDRWVGRVAFSPDGRRLATVHADGAVRLWDVQTGTRQLVLRGHGQPAGDVTFNGDGSRVLSASLDGTARLWDSRSGQELALLSHPRGHAVFHAAFGPWSDRSIILTAASDGKARLWDAKTYRLIAEMNGHRARISGAAFNADGTRVITASEDTTSRVFQVYPTTQALIDRACTSLPLVANGKAISDMTNLDNSTIEVINLETTLLQSATRSCI